MQKAEFTGPKLQGFPVSNATSMRLWLKAAQRKTFGPTFAPYTINRKNCWAIRLKSRKT